MSSLQRHLHLLLAAGNMSIHINSGELLFELINKNSELISFLQGRLQRNCHFPLTFHGIDVFLLESL